MGATVAEGSSDVELEFMRKEDSSWHPCQASLSPDISTGFGLIVDFGSHDSQEHIIHTKEEALARLRIRSTALRGDDCMDIKEGLHVLAYQETQLRSLLFDAVVEEVCRVRHSKRILCRCTFVIKWLQSDLKGGTMTVPSNSILKLAVRNIDCHPTVCKFLNSVKSLSCSSASPFSSLLEDTFSETDLSSVVEKQIEEINKVADASRNGCSEEILLMLKKDAVDFTGQARKVSFLREQASQVQNNSKRTTRSQSKTQQKTKDKSPPPIVPEPDRQHLSPLGARAALASLMFKLPQEAEFSICHLESEGFGDKSLSTPEKNANSVTFDVVDKLFRSGACFQEVSAKDNLFPRLEACPESLDQFVSKQTKDTKSADVSHKSSQIKGSRVTKNKVQKSESPCCTESDAANIRTSSICPVSDGKVNHPILSSRLTRSALQKGVETSNDELEVSSSAEEMKSSIPVRATRLTRSMIQNGVKSLSVEMKQGSGAPAHNACSDSKNEDFGAPETKQTKRKKSISSSLNAEENFAVAEENKKLRSSDDVTIATRTEGDHDSGKGEGIQWKKCNPSHQVKKSISKKPELRSSPRLRFLPRTRSQKR